MNSIPLSSDKIRRAVSRRVGAKVFVLSEDLWRNCKEYNVSDKDILREYNRFQVMGIPVTYSTAAAAALREKKRPVQQGRPLW